jgi:hypothetical protein
VDANTHAIEFAAKCVEIARSASNDMPEGIRKIIDESPYVLLKRCKSEADVEDKLIMAFIQSMRGMGGLKTKIEVQCAVSFLFSLIESYKRTLDVLRRVTTEKEVDVGT